MPLDRPEDRFWRTDTKTGRSVLALKTNDTDLPSEDDQILGVMESAKLADEVVALHNNAIRKFGRHFRRIMEVDE